MVDDQRLVFPVGQFGGIIRAETPGPTWFNIRRGDRLWSVEPDPGLLWLHAHGRTDDPAPTPWTRSAVLGRRGTKRSPADEAADYGQLVGLGLIAEVDPDDPAAVDFARTYQLVPLAHGMGNSSEDPRRFLAGFPPDLIATFTWTQWRLWRESHLEPSLWDGCRAVAANEERAGRTLDPRDLLTDTLRGLHVMLGIRLAYLDVAREDT